MPKPIEDFDSAEHLQYNDFFKGEKKLYLTILEHLRAGQLFEVQQKLQTAKCYEHLLMLRNASPLFDNIEFKEEMVGTEDLFLQDLERQANIHSVDYTESECQYNSVYGNRNNLMFIQQYHEVYKNIPPCRASQNKTEIGMLRGAAMGLQCGDLPSVE